MRSRRPEGPSLTGPPYPCWLLDTRHRHIHKWDDATVRRRGLRPHVKWRAEGRRENLAQANKLSRTYAALLEALNRHRGKGQQKVTVEHVHVHEGGQAIVGHVEGGGVTTKSENQPHALGYAPGETLWS